MPTLDPNYIIIGNAEKGYIYNIPRATLPRIDFNGSSAPFATFPGVHNRNSGASAAFMIQNVTRCRGVAISYNSYRQCQNLYSKSEIT